MPDFPSNLPKMNSSGYSRKAQSQTIRTSMDSGASKVRRRFTKPYINIKGELMLTPAQKTTFDTFFNSTLAGGSLSFTMLDDFDNTTKTWRFTDSPDYSFSNGYWYAGLSLEILP